MVRLIRVACISLGLIACLLYGGVTYRYLSSVDADKPFVNMGEDGDKIVISIHDSNEKILEGITATDKQDGDVSGDLVLESLGNFTSDGSREAVIAAFDKAGNVTKVTRRVYYRDYQEPRVILSGPLTVGLNRTQQLLSRIHVEDCLDGDISDSALLTLEGSHSNTTQIIAGGVAGAFGMRLQFSNSAGDTQTIPVTVEFYNTGETGRPELGLTDYLIYIDRGQKIDPLDYLDSITIFSRQYDWKPSFEHFEMRGGGVEDIILGSSIQIINPLDSSVPGVYEIQYSYTSAEGYKGSVRLIVIVEE